MSKENRTLASLNWLCWLQHTDYDVWLILMEYLKPIIDMRKTHKDIRYAMHPIFKKVCKSLTKDNLMYALTRNDIPIYSVSYLRWYTGKLNCETPWQVKEFFKKKPDDTRLYGLHFKTDSSWQKNEIRETKDEVIEVMKLNKIPYRKSWTKQKLMKTIMKHAIVD